MAKNKLAQATRRSIRTFVRNQYMILNKVIKPRPKFCPLWLWSLSARIFIDTKKLKGYMENGISVDDDVK